MKRPVCHLDAAVGRSTRCSGDACPFWKDERCAIGELPFDACLVTTLVGLRAGLAKRLPEQGLRDFHPPGLV